MLVFLVENSKDIAITLIGVLVGSLISALLTVWVTLSWIERAKQRNKRKTLMTVMDILAENVRETEPDYEGKGDMIFSKFRSETIWSLLESDTLNIKKEKYLFSKLVHLATHIDNFDSYVDAYNFSVFASNGEKGKQATKLLVEIHKKIRKEYKELEGMLRDSKLHDN
ncbi:hypothetical protein L8C07_05915 [Paenibacillus sp. CMAA1739]|uniref:hypothetical protein n=1 Tax=Paenibacillus ottowii TaxID=2315729 RepID=UPI002DBF1562|nr:hypothetical protein [Paenibacillus sp. CMAA1739]MEC4565475.1 hypothetical protein [Paenibacillus sp. CMAA1739]